MQERVLPPPTHPPTHPRTFSPSPIHLEVREEAEMEKNVAPDWLEMAFPISVLPVPARDYGI
jgi:hypothetical protein